MSRVVIGKHRPGYELRMFNKMCQCGGSSIYNNVIGQDPNKIAQVLIDLEMVGNLPIRKAISVYLERIEKKDWLGL